MVHSNKLIKWDLSVFFQAPSRAPPKIPKQPPSQDNLQRVLKR
jgi:hypothetical protein